MPTGPEDLFRLMMEDVGRTPKFHPLLATPPTVTTT
jgi:hypothetical protein